MSEPIVPPDNPTSAVLIRMEGTNGRKDIFAFLICFPRDARFDAGSKGVQLVIASRALKPHEALSSEMEVAKGYAAHVIDELLKRGRMDLIDRTNWPSVVASIAHMIEEFEAQRPRVPTTVQ